MNGPTIQLPEQMSTTAAQVDWLYYFIYWLSVVLFVAIVGTMVVFVWKYRRRPGVKAEPTGHNTALEIGWTVAPLFLLALLFHWGFKGYVNLRVAPANAMEIRVYAQKWLWTFEYPNGAGRSVNELHVPVNRPVRLVLSSNDVLHSFFVPAFRIKQDAVPGYYQAVWFEATHTGTTDLFCTEYCGTNHSSMIGRVVVETEEQHRAYLRTLLGPRQGESQPDYGRRLFVERCATCHGNNAEGGTGPRLRGIWGRQETMTNGESVNVDEAYVRQSILQPNVRVVRGFPAVMPSFSGQLDEGIELPAIITYIRSIGQ